MKNVYVVFKKNINTDETRLYDVFTIEEYAKQTVNNIMNTKAKSSNTVAFYQEHAAVGEMQYK